MIFFFFFRLISCFFSPLLASSLLSPFTERDCVKDPDTQRLSEMSPFSVYRSVHVAFFFLFFFAKGLVQACRLQEGEWKRSPLWRMGSDDIDPHAFCHFQSSVLSSCKPTLFFLFLGVTWWFFCLAIEQVEGWQEEEVEGGWGKGEMTCCSGRIASHGMYVYIMDFHPPTPSQPPPPPYPPSFAFTSPQACSSPFCTLGSSEEGHCSLCKDEVVMKNNFESQWGRESRD